MMKLTKADINKILGDARKAIVTLIIVGSLSTIGIIAKSYYEKITFFESLKEVLNYTIPLKLWLLLVIAILAALLYYVVNYINPKHKLRRKFKKRLSGIMETQIGKYKFKEIAVVLDGLSLKVRKNGVDKEELLIKLFVTNKDKYIKGIGMLEHDTRLLTTSLGDYLLIYDLVEIRDKQGLTLGKEMILNENGKLFLAKYEESNQFYYKLHNRTLH